MTNGDAALFQDFAQGLGITGDVDGDQGVLARLGCREGHGTYLVEGAYFAVNVSVSLINLETVNELLAFFDQGQAFVVDVGVCEDN